VVVGNSNISLSTKSLHTSDAPAAASRESTLERRKPWSPADRLRPLGGAHREHLYYAIEQNTPGGAPDKLLQMARK